MRAFARGSVWLASLRSVRLIAERNFLTGLNETSYTRMFYLTMFPTSLVSDNRIRTLPRVSRSM